MKKFLALLLALLMMLSVVALVACGEETEQNTGGTTGDTTTDDDDDDVVVDTPTDDDDDAIEYDIDTIKAWSDISIAVDDDTITVSGSDILELTISTFTTTNISSSGEVTTVTVVGVSVAEILADNDYSIDNMGDATILASDGYSQTVVREDYTDIYLLLYYNGATLTAPRSCVQDARSMYWVKNVSSVSFGTVADVQETSLVTEIQFFFGNIFSVADTDDALTASAMSYDGTDYYFYSTEEYYDLFVGSDPVGNISLLASGDFVSTVASSDTFYEFSISLLDEEHEDGPVYYKDLLSYGMKVKNLMYIVADGLAISVATSGDMADVMASVGMIESDTYVISTASGDSYTVSGDELSAATLYWSDTYGQCITFGSDSTLDDIVGLDNITVAVDTTTVSGWDDITISANGYTDIVLTADDILALDYEIFTAVQTSAEDPDEYYDIIAVSVEDIMYSNWGITLDDTTALSAVATDDWSTGMIAQDYEGGLYIMLVYNGSTLSAPRLCVDGSASGNWAKKLATLSFTVAE